MNALPTIPEVLADPCASYWLKDALRSAMRRDIVDALNDAGFLADLLTARIESLHESSLRKLEKRQQSRSESPNPISHN